MSLSINTNTQSIFAQRTFNLNTRALQKTTEKLSTGLRINRAADDAAGLSISQKLTAQIRGLDKAEQNISDGISLIQTAEAALSIIQEQVQRIRELAVQAANETNSNDELDAIQREINALVRTISDIGSDAEYNNIRLLNGNGGNDVVIQSGPDQGDTTTINISDFDVRIAQASAARNINFGLAAGEEIDNFHVGGSGIVIASGGAGSNNGDLDDLDQVITNLSRMRTELGATQNSLEAKLEYTNIAKENALASRSRIVDADIARESSQLVKQQILQQTAAAMLSQANAGPQVALTLVP